MRPSRLMATASLILAAALLTGCGTTDAVPAGPSFYDNLSRGGQVDSEAAAKLISDYRQGRGLPAVTVDPVLTTVAQRQAKAMAAADQLSHSVGGRSLTVRLKAAGFDGLKAVENVGAGYHTLAEAFSGWRDSPSHNKNMLVSGATRMGIATALAPNSKYKVYWALVLAVPDPKTTAPDAAAPAVTGSAPAGPPAPGDSTLTINGAPVPAAR